MKTYIPDPLFVKWQTLNKRFQCIKGGQHHCPVVDETLTNDVIINLVFYFVQCPFPSFAPSGLEVITEMQKLNSDVCRTGITKLNELVKLVRFLFGSLTSLGFQEEDAREQCRISCRHLLTCQYHSAINIGAFPSFPVSTAFRASGIVIDTFKKVDMLMTEGVFVFVEVDDHIADLGTLITHCIVGCTLQITDFRVALEQADDTNGKLGLSCAFLTIDVQQRKRTCTVDDDVTEQGGHIKTECHHPIVAIQINYQGEILFQGDIHPRIMHKATFIDKPCTIRLVYLRHGWQVEVLGVKTDDAIFVDGLPLASIDNTIAEGIEALLANIVPAHLRDTQGFLGLFIHEGFQQFVLFLFLEETEISLTLYLVFEPFKLGDIQLSQLNGLADATLILQLEDSGWRLVIGNQEQRMDDKVCPVTLPSLLVKVVIMTATTIETVALQLVIFLHGLTMLLLLKSPCRIGKGCLPYGCLLELALQVAKQGGLHDIALYIYQQVTDFTNCLQLIIVGAIHVIVLVGIPKDKVFLRQGFPLFHAGDIRVGILLDLPIRRDFPHGHLEAKLGGKPAILEDELFAFPEPFTFLRDIGIRDKTQRTAEPTEGVQLFF